jgi:hypothetical protein
MIENGVPVQICTKGHVENTQRLAGSIEEMDRLNAQGGVIGFIKVNA